MTAPLSRESVERMMALCEKAATANNPSRRVCVRPNKLLALCNLALSTMDRGDPCGCCGTALIHQRGVEGCLEPRPPATPVATGGDGRVVSDAMTEAVLRWAMQNDRDEELEQIREMHKMVLASRNEAAERTRNEVPSAAVTVTDAMVGAAREVIERELGPVFARPSVVQRAIQAALAAAPGGKESHDHPTPEEFAKYLAWRFQQDGVEIKPEEALRVSSDLLRTFSIWTVMA